MLLALLALALIAVVLAAPLGIRRVRDWRARRPTRAADGELDLELYDPGRERRAEQRARELLRSCVNAEEWGMYRDLGFIRVAGRHARREIDRDRGAHPAYAYLVYPHKPIVAYVPETGQLLSEYCVGFPDRSEPEPSQRLPDADDILAKWMSLRAGERELISMANMHVPGRQVDPGQAGRDLIRLREWRARRVAQAA